MLNDKDLGAAPSEHEWLMYPTVRHAVLSRLNWVIDQTGGTAEQVLRERLGMQPAGDVDDLGIYLFVAGRDRFRAAEHIEDCMAALRFRFEEIGIDGQTKTVHFRIWGSRDGSDDQLVTLIAGSSGAQITRVISEQLQYHDDAELYYAGYGEVMGRVSDVPMQEPVVSDPQRAFAKMVRARRLIRDNSTRGVPTKAVIDVVANRSNPTATIVQPFFGVRS